MLQLNEIEVDVLTEAFNIGVGQAASAMSLMVNEEVKLSVPSLTVISRAEAARQLSNNVGQRMCGVSQKFVGPFNADAILMFPESKSLEIVRLMVGEDIPLAELTDMEQEALSEIGNIILNALVGTLANVFDSEFIGSLPTFHLGTSAEILKVESDKDFRSVMLLHIDFSLERHSILGYVVFLLDISSVNDIKDSIRRFLGNMP